MTQDNKDAALELAKECGINTYALNALAPEITNYYNAARKPIEEDNCDLRMQIHVMSTQISCEVKDLQSSIITMREALVLSRPFIERAINTAVSNNFGYADDWANKCIEVRDIINEALANPPSLEAMERKKLEDEIAVLEQSRTVKAIVIDVMIAERKAKLEKMK